MRKQPRGQRGRIGVLDPPPPRCDVGQVGVLLFCRFGMEVQGEWNCRVRPGLPHLRLDPGAVGA